MRYHIWTEGCQMNEADSQKLAAGLAKLGWREAAVTGDTPCAYEGDAHPGGNREFWSDELVRGYDLHQSVVSEKKEEALATIARIASRFRASIWPAPLTVLDVGCGPGTLSTRILDALPGSVVTGVDASDQMIAAAKRSLGPKYGDRFAGYVSDFNSDAFWTPQIDQRYDIVASSIALHYLSDRRRSPFLREVRGHLKSPGLFVACIATRSGVPEIAEMEAAFRAEFTHRQLQKAGQREEIEQVARRCAEEDARANVNWRSPRDYLVDMEVAGFEKADIVWQHWAKSIFVALT